MRSANITSVLCNPEDFSIERSREGAAFIEIAGPVASHPSKRGANILNVRDPVRTGVSGISGIVGVVRVGYRPEFRRRIDKSVGKRVAKGTLAGLRPQGGVVNVAVAFNHMSGAIRGVRGIVATHYV